MSLRNLLAALLCSLSCALNAQSAPAYEARQYFLCLEAEADAAFAFDEASTRLSPWQASLKQAGVRRLSKPFFLEDPTLSHTYLVETDRELDAAQRAALSDMAGVRYLERVPHYESFY